MSESDYSAATRKCDIVMKGGITSGIVYPRAVSRLAKDYRFQSIGGTSAGAIAAAVTAAAEYSRNRGTIVFEKLNAIPQWLGESSAGRNSNLLNLFQPQAGSEGLFRIALAFLVKPWWRRLLKVIQAVWLDLLIGTLPGVFVAILAVRYPKVGIALGLLVAMAGAVVCGAIGILLRILRLCRHRFGLCTGYKKPQEGQPPTLTDWLNDLINSLAQHQSDKPLTFGDLRRHGVTLKVIATCLTFARPYTLPFESGEFYFSPEEMRLFFPSEVVSWMEEHSSTASSHGEQVDAAGLKRLPPADDLPVIVAVRMSLSFPVLFCAVPLYAVDWTRRRRTVKEPIPSKRVAGDALAQDELRRPEQVWFSDGGICSNFPLHLFDSPLPRWPTFAVDLADVRPDREGDQRRVWMPSTNRGGIAFGWTRLDCYDTWSIMSFLFSIVDSARNWVDNLQAMVPGYRDRIAHIYLDGEQGGLNLNMSAVAVNDIAGYGEQAAEALIDRFVKGVENGKPTEMNWENQRWVRYRSTMATLSAFLSRYRLAYEQPAEHDPSYLTLINRGADAVSYPFTPEQVECAAMIAADLDRLSKEVEACRLELHSPRPEPALRVRPQF
jgi:predicted acylesterase/phospholipase RssA